MNIDLFISHIGLYLIIVVVYNLANIKRIDEKVIIFVKPTNVAAVEEMF